MVPSADLVDWGWPVRHYAATVDDLASHGRATVQALKTERDHHAARGNESLVASVEREIAIVLDALNLLASVRS